jgi:hypothetical protein
MKLNLKINSKESDTLISFARDNQKCNKYFNPNGSSRQYCILNRIDHEIKYLALNLWNEKYTELGITEFLEEPMYGIFLGVNNEGGFVHSHTDAAPKGYYHTRINFLLSKPESGGLPIYNNTIHDYEEGASWLNLANVWSHSSTPVLGKKDRIVLSLGALIKREIINGIFNSSIRSL